MLRTITVMAALLASALGAEAALGQSHQYVNYMRSSTTTHLFVQQSIDGEYGRYVSSGKAEPTSAYWRGYGIGTTLGLEMIKFVQVVAGHTFVNMRYRDDALESLTGSRLNAGVRFVFTAPVVNLELGGGLLGSRLDYQKQLDNASLYGSGSYYSLGLNYFMSSRVSFFYEAKLSQEHLVRQGGSAAISAIDTDATHMGVGFRIWL